LPPVHQIPVSRSGSGPVRMLESDPVLQPAGDR
jgi:hypothetical protein